MSRSSSFRSRVPGARWPSRCRRWRDGLALADHALGHALVASAVVLVQNADVPGLAGADYTLLYTAEGLPEDVEAELAAVSNTLRAHGARLIIETDRSGLDVWSGFLGSTQDDQMLIRAGVPAKHLDRFLTEQPGNRPSEDGRQLCIDCAGGLVYAKGSLHRRSERPGRCSRTAAAGNRHGRIRCRHVHAGAISGHNRALGL